MGDSPGKNTGVGFHVLLQGIFPTQGSNLGLLHCRQILYHPAIREAQKDVGSTRIWTQDLSHPKWRHTPRTTCLFGVSPRTPDWSHLPTLSGPSLLAHSVNLQVCPCLSPYVSLSGWKSVIRASLSSEAQTFEVEWEEGLEVSVLRGEEGPEGAGASLWSCSSPRWWVLSSASRAPSLTSTPHQVPSWLSAAPVTPRQSNTGSLG